MRKNSSKIVLILIFILFLLSVVVLIAINSLQSAGALGNNNSLYEKDISNTTTDANTAKPGRSIKQIIEDAGSVYKTRTGSYIQKIYVEFKYDLYDEQGKSYKNYFYDLIEELVPVVQDNFYLIDEKKSIEIFVGYDSKMDTYVVTINGIEDFYDKTQGETYVNLGNAEIVKQSAFSLTNTMLLVLANKNMFFANTEYADESRVDIGNGYYSYNDGTMYAKLAGGRVLNTVLTEKYTEEISSNIYVGTELSEIVERFPNLAFGSEKEGYLGYRINNYYVFIYDDQMSFYEYRYDANSYFDEYLSDYCKTGNLQKLYEDFTTEWDSYFEKEYDPEKGRLKVTFPTRGIDIDIVNNDSKGIKIYNNYYLTDTVKELIKTNKITLEEGKDLIQITEAARRETMR